MAGFDLTADWQTPTRPGAWGELSFDATNNIIEIDETAALMDVTGRGTMVVWVRLRSMPGDSGMILQLRNGASNNIAFFWFLGGSAVRIQYKAGGTTSSADTTADDSDNLWWRLGLTWDVAADEVKVYENGKQFGSTLTTLGTWSGAPTLNSIGGQTGPTLLLNGLVDDVRFLTNVWSSAQFTEDYRLSQQFYPGLLNRRGRRGVVAAAPAVGNPWYHNLQQMAGAA